MAKQRSILQNWSEYLALRGGVSLLNMFEIDDCLQGARGVGSLMYRLDRRHRVRGIANIRRCLPHVSQDEAERIVEASMQHFLQLGVEVMFTTRLISLDSWAERVKLTDLGEALEVMLSDRPTVMVTGHFGNWELLGYVLATVGLDMDAIARPIDNPMLNRWLLGVRERQGMRIITKWGATERMARVMNTGGMLGFIGDQNAGDNGMFVPFFGRLASAYKSIGLLAMNFNAPVVCGYARRTDKTFHYEMGTTDIIYPEDWADQPDPLYYLTARYTRAMEAMVRLCPEQYLWIHRRWKSRPKHEREGTAMPRSLRRKLEGLPWMTDELMGEVAQPVENANPK
jgi:KDO2-lipid IV(A) lauroyltransferase